MFCRKMSESRMEYRLKNTPGDCIQSVKFGPSSSQFLLVASWDKSVRLFDVVNNNMRLQYQHSGPVLDCCFQVLVGAIYKYKYIRIYYTVYSIYIILYSMPIC